MGDLKLIVSGAFLRDFGFKLQVRDTLPMVAPPSPRAILSLYGSTLRAARSFSSYNFRNYFLRRTKDTFRSMQVEKNQIRLSLAYNEAVNELEVLRRSAVVDQLYGGRRLAVEH